MKKNKSKSKVKKAKKTALKGIKIILVKELNEVTAKFGKTSKKVKNTIKKESKKFARILSKKLKLKKIYSLVSDSVPEVTAQAATLAKKVQAVANPILSQNKPVRQRTASTKTSTPALSSAKKVTRTPVTRAKAVKKLQDEA